MPYSEVIDVCTPRPSDPSEIVCILFSCGQRTCPAPAAGALVGTAAMLNDYIESPAAAKAGHRWLSI